MSMQFRAGKTGLILGLLCIFMAANATVVSPQGVSRRYALLIAGLGGAPEYTETYHSYLYETRKAFVETFGFQADDITVLADSAPPEEPFINGVSSADNIRAAFSRLAGNVTGDDEVYVILFGHGSFDGTHAMLNIPREDLTDAEYAGMVDTLDARRIVFINTASCSGPFIAVLSAPGRIVITATKSGTERNDTRFSGYLVEALKSDTSDRDKNGDLSILEVYLDASDRTDRWYEETGHLATEHPLLDDTGDRIGYGAGELDDRGEGALARNTYLLDRNRIMAAAVAGTDDSLLVALFTEQQAVTRAIAGLQEERENYPEEEYLARLEPLFIRLAEINDAIEIRRNDQ